MLKYNVPHGILSWVSMSCSVLCDKQTEVSKANVHKAELIGVRNIMEDNAKRNCIGISNNFNMENKSDRTEKHKRNRPCNVLLISDNSISPCNLGFLLYDLFSKNRIRCVFDICSKSDVLDRLSNDSFYDILFLPKSTLEDSHFFQAYSTSASWESPVIVLKYFSCYFLISSEEHLNQHTRGLLYSRI